MIAGVVLRDQVKSIQTVLKVLCVFPTVLILHGGALLHKGHDLQGGRLEPTNLLFQGSGSFDTTG